MEDSKQSLLDNFIPQLKSFVKSDTVFGEPYVVGEVTIIPVNSVKVGFGFGTGGLIKAGESSGGGGGVLLTPVAFLIIKDNNVSIHNLNGKGIDSILEKAPEALDKLISVIKNIQDKK